ncbi:hypothetical protein JCM10207_003126 [Rhodosporidiobolus poonsookiae]
MSFLRNDLRLRESPVLAPPDPALATLPRPVPKATSETSKHLAYPTSQPPPGRVLHGATLINDIHETFLGGVEQRLIHLGRLEDEVPEAVVNKVRDAVAEWEQLVLDDYNELNVKLQYIATLGKAVVFVIRALDVALDYPRDSIVDVQGEKYLEDPEGDGSKGSLKVDELYKVGSVGVLPVKWKTSQASEPVKGMGSKFDDALRTAGVMILQDVGPLRTASSMVKKAILTTVRLGVKLVLCQDGHKWALLARRDGHADVAASRFQRLANDNALLLTTIAPSYTFSSVDAIVDRLLLTLAVPAASTSAAAAPIAPPLPMPLPPVAESSSTTSSLTSSSTVKTTAVNEKQQLFYFLYPDATASPSLSDSTSPSASITELPLLDSYTHNKLDYIMLTDLIGSGVSCRAWSASFGGMQFVVKSSRFDHEDDLRFEYNLLASTATLAEVAIPHLFLLRLEEINGESVWEPDCDGEARPEKGKVFVIMQHGGDAPAEWTDLTQQQKTFLFIALLRMHAAGILHGDAEPRNTVVKARTPNDPLGSPRWIDFAQAEDGHICEGRRCGELDAALAEMGLEGEEEHLVEAARAAGLRW